MAWEARSGLKLLALALVLVGALWLNGLGSPFGIETLILKMSNPMFRGAKWPGKPVRD